MGGLSAAWKICRSWAERINDVTIGILSMAGLKVLNLVGLSWKEFSSSCQEMDLIPRKQMFSYNVRNNRKTESYEFNKHGI